MSTMTRWIDSACWVLYLCSVLTCSFLTQPYQSVYWLWFSALFYLLFACYCLNMVWHGGYKQRVFRSALPVISILILALLWLLVQTQCWLAPAWSLTLNTDLSSPHWFASSCAYSMTPIKTAWLFLENLFVLVWFIMALSLVRSRRRLKQLLLCILSVIMLHAAVGVLAKYGGVLLVNQATLDGHYNVARAWFVNRNHFAAFVNMGLFVAFILFIKEVYKERLQFNLAAMIDWVLSPKAIVLFTVVLAAIASMLSQSRAGLLSLCVAILVISLLMVAVDNKKVSVTKTIGFIAFILLLALIINGQSFLQRLTEDALTIGERQLQWAMSFELIKEKVWLGYGGGSYATIFQHFRGYQDLRNVVFDQAHNGYLHLWLEQGLIGLLLWLSVLIITLYRLICSYKHTRSTLVKAVMLGCLGVILAAALQSMVDFNLQIMNLKCYFFLFIAMVFVTPYVNHKNMKQARRINKKQKKAYYD